MFRQREHSEIETFALWISVRVRTNRLEGKKMVDAYQLNLSPKALAFPLLDDAVRLEIAQVLKVKAVIATA